jgi:two-component system response regulator PilR (NtrC family)
MSARKAGGGRLLFVDDEPGMRKTVSHLLKKEGYQFDTAASGKEAKEKVEGEVYDLVITDIRMPDCSGLEVLRHVRDVSPSTTVMLVSAYASLEYAVEALKLGARDLVTKNPGFIEELRLRIGNLLKGRRLEGENARLRRALRSRYQVEGIVGTSPAMKEVLSLVERIAGTNSTVLVTGESGTGKEVVAKGIHFNSLRREEPFVSINCGALPDELLESELFGHVKGAFTGAVNPKKGLFEVAHDGTILLDEIGETSAAMQVKLLRVLQERRFRRVGGTEELEVDVRVIAATNQDLSRMVEEKRFREDLFYRINVIPIRIPALRERSGDIPLLAEHFLTRFRRSMDKPLRGISDGAMDLLEAYSWPGNVRELENVIERAVALETTDSITVESLSREVRLAPRTAAADKILEPIPASGFDLEGHLEERRQAYMLAALEKAGGVQARAARSLGMSFRSFRYFAGKYGLSSSREAAAESSDE